MNRFRVAKGSEEAFEQVWLSRDSHLDKVPGLWRFTFLKQLEGSFYGSTPGCKSVPPLNSG
jgi:heme-degrading monooxygenase HmoA